MKKSILSSILSLLCALVLLTLCTLPALADGIDLTGKTDDEIIALLLQVNQEIASRGICKTAKLSKGSYIAGKDLPVGTYVYTCMATGSDWGNLTIYSEEGKGKQLLWKVMTAPKEGEEAETVFMRLNDGDQLKSEVAFSLTISGGVVFQ